MRVLLMVALGASLVVAAGCGGDDDDSGGGSASTYEDRMDEELDDLSDLMREVGDLSGDIASADDPQKAVSDLLAKAREVSNQTGLVSSLEPDDPKFAAADAQIEEAVATLDLSMAALQTGLEPGGTVDDINLGGEPAQPGD